ncbi:MAG: M3 family metallopeptidase [Verrucomicrobia bacterium]|nr:M3 family metallopeptidase [Verrucomicrobiota bacterium]
MSSLILAAAVASLAQTAESNPLLKEWRTPFGLPPFAEIREEHFLPAIKEGMARQRREVAAITASSETPTFANTIEALERSGRDLDRAGTVFRFLTGAETNDRLQALATELAPLQSAHRDTLLLDDALFRRIKAVWDARGSLALTPEQRMLMERTYKRFARGGALLDNAGKEKLRVLNAELASLSVRFGDNLLKEMNAWRLVADRRDALKGLPGHLVSAAADTARKAGLDGKWAFTLHAPSLWPFLQYCPNREWRRQIFTAYTTRGNHGDGTDNKAVASRTAALRTQKARLLGHPTWADFVLEENMARTPARVYELLDQLWGPAKALAAREAEALQAAIKAEGNDFPLEPWDWFYYAENVRRAAYRLDESALRPYFRLENVREGAFWVARKLYGITFTELQNMPVHHPEARLFEVKDADGTHLAVFIVDDHPRAGKRSGAWSTQLRGTWIEEGKSVRPLVANVCNFSRPAGDEPALLTLDEVETLFHEFGHALHSILSRVRYRSLGGTPTDFVELPSQIMENWALEPEVLAHYARHWQTGEEIPAALVEKIHKASTFNQGFKTVEYLAASLLDMEWHTLAAAAEPDAPTLENVALARMNIPKQIVPRYRSTYFQHIFSGGYSAGYYSYIWAEVLDTDAFQAFKDKGLFDQATARSFRTNILEKGHSEEPMVLYERFRGRAPSVQPLLEKRGLK